MQTTAQQIDIQGHRGARGIMPENTIPAFIYALEQGVTTLELDVVITADKKVVVSHEPWISSEICQGNSGEPLSHDKNEMNIYHMTYDQVKKYDCGSKTHSRFPQQEKVKVSKPLLSDVIKSVEKHIKSYTRYEVDYNIEIKSSPSGDNKFHPAPGEFSDIVYKLIDEYLPWERVVMQSFDFRILRYWNNRYPDVRLAALVENTKSVATNLANLGIKPAIYSPNYRLMSKKKIAGLHGQGIKVIPWTVNDTTTMKKLLSWKVDGIITDYPNRAAGLGLISPKTE
ncbi:glycerophosphodiester phosphodiesterase [Fulvivirga sp. M361]|uniref:glycerophosphodiester phosphodiesterase n=1 Tax=Fulvivirga sp. M361 TaxID=2594266 RepID=UPI00117AB646|nr:glycerophosphodiester phosphodiesterase [Fulvivirga sp. M361]TRX62528.1 glycerophosphodiester phosphodiesterase [Fulvivirga sp. M361]